MHHTSLLLVPDVPPLITLGQPQRVLLTRGEKLSLSCSTSNVNSDIKINWKAPRGVVRHKVTSSHLSTPFTSHLSTLFMIATYIYTLHTACFIKHSNHFNQVKPVYKSILIEKHTVGMSACPSLPT